MKSYTFYGTVPQKRSFDAASASRLFNNWTTTNRSADSKIRRELVTVRARSRDVCDNDDYGRKFISLCKTNIIGPNGFALNMDVRDPGGTQDTYACNLIEDAWYKAGSAANFTVAGDLDRVTAENLLLETAARDGEVIIRKVKGANNPFGFAVQLIEPDYLDEDYNEVRAGGNYVKMGVEFEPNHRRRVAYWFRTLHPGDDFMLTSQRNRGDRVRIPANEIIHRFIPAYIEQTRGMPWLQTAMTRLKMLGGFEDAAVVAARIAACKMAYLERDATTMGQDYQADAEEDDGTQVNDMEPGIFEQLPFGMRVKTVDWNNPNPDHGAFVKAMLRGACAGLLCSYNSVANDLEGVNYSSIRAGLLEERESWKLLQNWWIQLIELEIFSEWLLMALTTGAINLPLAKFEKFNKPVFSGRRWPWVDPQNDMAAAIMAIDRGLTTRQQVVADLNGGSIEENYVKSEADLALQKEHGLDFRDTKEKVAEKIQLTPAVDKKEQ